MTLAHSKSLALVEHDGERWRVEGYYVLEHPSDAPPVPPVSVRPADIWPIEAEYGAAKVIDVTDRLNIYPGKYVSHADVMRLEIPWNISISA